MEHSDHIKMLLQDRKKVCIFVGAGASMMEPCGLPSFQKLNHQLIQLLHQPGSEEWEKQIAGLQVKPEQLLQIIWDYTDGKFNPVDSFQYALPNINHYLIAQLASEGVHCIVTPNFDSCIEKALESRSLSYDLFSKTPDRKEEADKLRQSIDSERITIWKPHGDCRMEDTLCYTRTKVARLSSSLYLQQLFTYIIQNYDLLFLGYSGYDDDFFPILYQCIPGSGRQIVWNTYETPVEHAPSLSLQSRSPSHQIKKNCNPCKIYE